MGRAIVNNPKDTPSCFVRRLAHDIFDQLIKREDATSTFASTEQFAMMDIERSQIGPSATSGVFMFHLHRLARLGWIGRMATATRLNARFFIGRQNKFVILKGLTIPCPVIEIQNPASFFGKLRIPGKNPRAVTPGTNSILMEPSPYRAIAHGSSKTRLSDFPAQISNAPSRKRYMMGQGQFTGQCLNLNDDLRGKKPVDVPGGVVHPVQGGVLQRNVFAIC